MKGLQRLFQSKLQEELQGPSQALEEPSVREMTGAQTCEVLVMAQPFLRMFVRECDPWLEAAEKLQTQSLKGAQRWLAATRSLTCKAHDKPRRSSSFLDVQPLDVLLPPAFKRQIQPTPAKKPGPAIPAPRAGAAKKAFSHVFNSMCW